MDAIWLPNYSDSDKNKGAWLGCIFSFSALILGVFLILMIAKGCNSIGESTSAYDYHGQITEIDSLPARGYVATVVLDSDKIHVPLTVAQANQIKIGDIVDLTLVHDGWGFYKYTKIRAISPK